MEIFSKGICFTAWGEVYAGLKRQWLTASNVFDYCNEQKISCCSEKRLIDLYIAYDESLFSFYELIKSFMSDESDPLIDWNEDSLEQDINKIPSVYMEIWQLEFLLRVKNSNCSIEQKLDKIVEYYYLFNYPEEWTHFIRFQPNKNLQFGKSLVDVYSKFNNYVEFRVNVFMNK